jgi:selenide, water dikinase
MEESSLLPQQLQSPLPRPPQQHLVLIGGGHAHVQVVKAMRARPSSAAHHNNGWHVTLIDVVAAATYSGMVPGCLAGVYTVDETLLPLQPLAEWANCTFVQDTVVDIDLEQRLIYLQNNARNPPIYFDALSLDIGSVSRGYLSTVGAREHAIPTRPIHALVARLNQARRDHSSTTVSDTTPATAVAPATTTKIVVIGGGVAGMELAMVVTSRWRQDNDNNSSNGNNVECTILDANPRRDDNGDNDAPLDATSNAIRSVLASKRIAIRHGCHVVRIDEHCIHCRLSGKVDEHEDTMVTTIPYTHCIWATGAGAHALPRHLIADRHLDGTTDGWIAVHPTLQSTSHDCVFAAGDCAHMVHHGDIPKAGVYAVRAGPILIENLTRYLESLQSSSSNNNSPRTENPNGATGETIHDGRPHPMPPSAPQLIPYVPQDDFLKLLVCGDGTALGFRFGLVLQGKWVFELKDHIDRSFMKLFDVASFEPDQGNATSSGRYDTRQYDSDLALDEVRFSPAAAANLLQRTDDAVDFREAQVILRTMGNDVSYRQAVLKCIHESKIASALQRV